MAVVITLVGAGPLRSATERSVVQPVPASAHPFLPQHPSGAWADEPILGMQFEAVTPALAQAAGLPVAAGALVRALQAGGPAERAGVQVDDVILQVDDSPVDADHPLTDVVVGIHVRGRFSLTIWRAGQQLTLTVDLTQTRDDVQS